MTWWQHLLVSVVVAVGVMLVLWGLVNGFARRRRCRLAEALSSTTPRHGYIPAAYRRVHVSELEDGRYCFVGPDALMVRTRDVDASLELGIRAGEWVYLVPAQDLRATLLMFAAAAAESSGQ